MSRAGLVIQCSSKGEEENWQLGLQQLVFILKNKTKQKKKLDQMGIAESYIESPGSPSLRMLQVIRLVLTEVPSQANP